MPTPGLVDIGKKNMREQKLLELFMTLCPPGTRGRPLGPGGIARAQKAGEPICQTKRGATYRVRKAQRTPVKSKAEAGHLARRRRKKELSKQIRARQKKRALTIPAARRVSISPSREKPKAEVRAPKTKPKPKPEPKPKQIEPPGRFGLTPKQIRARVKRLVGKTSITPKAQKIMRKYGVLAENLINAYYVPGRVKYAISHFENAGLAIAIDGPGIEVSRTIDFEDKVCYHDYFTLRKTGTSKGKEFLKGCFSLYETLGLEEIQLQANLNVGGYVWARCGFVPAGYKKYTMGAELEQKARSLGIPNPPKLEDFANWAEFSQATRPIKENTPLRRIAESKHCLRRGKNGMELQIGKLLLLGTSWKGEISIKSPNYQKFKAYVNKGKP